MDFIASSFMSQLLRAQTKEEVLAILDISGGGGGGGGAIEGSTTISVLGLNIGEAQLPNVATTSLPLGTVIALTAIGYELAFYKLVDTALLSGSIVANDDPSKGWLRCL